MACNSMQVLGFVKNLKVEGNKMTWTVSEKRSLKGEDQWTNHHCVIWNPTDFHHKYIKDGEVLFFNGSVEDYRKPGDDNAKVYRTFNVRDVKFPGCGGKKATRGPESRPSEPEDGDDLPF